MTEEELTLYSRIGIGWVGVFLNDRNKKRKYKSIVNHAIVDNA